MLNENIYNSIFTNHSISLYMWVYGIYQCRFNAYDISWNSNLCDIKETSNIDKQNGVCRMTITNYDRFALIPTRCSKCNRLFIFEPYDIYYKEVGINYFDLEQVICKKCKEK